MIILKSSSYYYAGMNERGLHLFVRKELMSASGFEMVIVSSAKFVYQLGSFEDNVVFHLNPGVGINLPKEVLHPMMNDFSFQNLLGDSRIDLNQYYMPNYSKASVIKRSH